MNPAVYADPQVIPQLVLPRGRGRPTIYSQELVEEFCGLIVNGLTIERACKEAGMPSKRTIQYWLKKYPEFRADYEKAVLARTQWWMDECVDIADNAPEGASIAKVNARINSRWKQINASNQRLLHKSNAGDGAKLVGDDKIIDHDPVHGMLYRWEIEYQKNEQARANARLNGHSDGRDK
jgi:hypothetical protein